MKEWCKGCKFHKFPYEAQLPVKINGKYERKIFYNNEDVHNVIELLIKETRDMNQEGESFDIASSISQQLPFFSCMNVLYDPSSSRDIERYVYSKELNVPPYSGTYGEQPKIWVDKMFMIKNAFAKKESDIRKKESKNG
tara:strand:- start:51 stop:467 length:417 start_codon:yes stop_codon:yes gene_type:complete